MDPGTGVSFHQAKNEGTQECAKPSTSNIVALNYENQTV